MEKEPFDSPGNDALNDWLAWEPIVVDGVADAKPGKVGRITEAIDVLRRVSRSTRIGADRRVNHKNTDVGILEIPAVETSAREIYDADAIGLANGPQRALPYSHPLALRHKIELRALRPQFLILFDD
jgi:hypothetical protein